jgi:putative ABC transport system substrate-binding protein
LTKVVPTKRSTKKQLSFIESSLPWGGKNDPVAQARGGRRRQSQHIGPPVTLGLVASLNRPGGNLAGIANLSNELAQKQLQLLRESLPNAAVFGVLADLAFPTTQSTLADLQAAARTLGLQLIVVNARTDNDLEPALASFLQQHVGAVLVGPAGTFFSRRTERLAALAARHALPAMFSFREFALAGGLMSYGSSQGYFYHQVGIYAGHAGRILKGQKPADLPVQQVIKLDLVINLKTAKALGLTIPETLLACKLPPWRRARGLRRPMGYVIMS